MLRLTVCLSVCLCLSVSVCLCLSVSVCLSVCLSVCASVVQVDSLGGAFSPCVRGLEACHHCLITTHTYTCNLSITQTHIRTCILTYNTQTHTCATRIQVCVRVCVCMYACAVVDMCTPKQAVLSTSASGLPSSTYIHTKWCIQWSYLAISINNALTSFDAMLENKSL